MDELPFFLPENVGHRVWKAGGLLKLVSVFDAFAGGNIVEL